MDLLRDQSAAAPVTDETSARLEAILDTALDSIITTNQSGTIETFNRAAEEMFGYKANEVIGCNVSMFVPAPHAKQHKQYMHSYMSTGTSRVIGRRREIRAMRRDGSLFPIELALSAVDVGGRRIFTGIIRDVTRRWAAETELLDYREHLEQMVAERTAALENVQEALRGANANLKQMVRIDELTGIGNRRAFDERLAIEWRRQQRNGNPLSVLICDVDLFKYYNDHLGHPAGDVCLRQIAHAFGECFQRATEFAARYGGEEFAAVLANTGLRSARERAEVLRRNVLDLAIEHPALGADKLVTVSVGVASIIPDRTTESMVLIEAADTALYRAKRNGRNCVEVARPATVSDTMPARIPSQIA